VETGKARACALAIESSPTPRENSILGSSFLPMLKKTLARRVEPTDRKVEYRGAGIRGSLRVREGALRASPPDVGSGHWAPPERHSRCGEEVHARWDMRATIAQNEEEYGEEESKIRMGSGSALF